MTDWRGIPREKIPWFPAIDSEKCIGCQACVEFCKNGVLEFDENEQKVRVRAPYKCVVECSTCGRLCPSEAISFPEEKVFSETLNKLLKEFKGR